MSHSNNEAAKRLKETYRGVGWGRCSRCGTRESVGRAAWDRVSVPKCSGCGWPLERGDSPLNARATDLLSTKAARRILRAPACANVRCSSKVSRGGPARYALCRECFDALRAAGMAVGHMSVWGKAKQGDGAAVIKWRRMLLTINRARGL